MKKLMGLLVSALLLILLFSGAFVDVLKFFVWLFTLQYITPDTSIAGSIIVKVLTFAVSYSLVGLIFKFFGLFDKKLMSMMYFIISTILGFILAYIVMIIEKHLLTIGIVLGAIFIIAIILLIVINFKNKD